MYVILKLFHKKKAIGDSTEYIFINYCIFIEAAWISSYNQITRFIQIKGFFLGHLTQD